MSKTRTKATRRNKPLRAKARNFVRLWYEDRVSRNEARYRAVNSRPVLTQATSSTSEYRPEQPWNKPLTANGKQTRPPPQSRPLMHAMNVDAYGEYQLNPDLEFIRRAMLHVINVHPDSHKALEMDAAGMTVEGISDELGCGERLARDYLGDGLAVLCSCIILRNDLGW